MSLHDSSVSESKLYRKSVDECVQANSPFDEQWAVNFNDFREFFLERLLNIIRVRIFRRIHGQYRKCVSSNILPSVNIEKFGALFEILRLENYCIVLNIDVLKYFR